MNYTTVDVPNMKSKCTYDLQLRLSSLDNDTLYKLRVSAIGRGGERATPNELLFRTKPAGKMTSDVTCTPYMNIMYRFFYVFAIHRIGGS